MTKPNSELLAKKAKRLLADDTLPGRRALANEFLAPFSEIGRLALMGGAVRDLAFMPVSEFNSDLDFVVEVEDRDLFDTFVRTHSLLRNSFGGYRLRLQSLNVDFWDVAQTWAGVRGLRNVETLEDVLETTFFNIDALMYIVDEGRVVEREGTLESIGERRLAINLKENPNPVGASVRTLRRMHQFELSLADELAAFVAHSIDAYGWRCLVKRDFDAYPTRPLLHAMFADVPRGGSDFLDIIAGYENRLPYPLQLELWDAPKKSA